MIVAELQQLSAEFEDVEFDLKQGLIGVTTIPIVLEDTHLGPFAIDLNLSRMTERFGVDCFNITALEPNPAASQEDTVHPHVQDDGHVVLDLIHGDRRFSWVM